MFEKEIEEYERVRANYQENIADRMSREQWMEYNEILFSAHSCAIEGNSFTVDDTRILREQGMAMIPVGRSLLECTEMADHFRAFDYMAGQLDHPFDEALLKEVNRLVTEHTLAYRAPGSIAGEYTTEDMAAGDTVFGDHEKLIARVPSLMTSTEKAIGDGLHPLIVAAKWHGYYEYREWPDGASAFQLHSPQGWSSIVDYRTQGPFRVHLRLETDQDRRFRRIPDCILLQDRYRTNEERTFPEA